MRFFNTAGPVDCTDHYCLPPLERFDLSEIEMLLAQKKYFVLHAPRQTGKTSSMLALVDYLNAGGRYRALYCNVETAQTAREDVAKGMKSILVTLGTRAAKDLGDDFLLKNREQILSECGEHDALTVALSRFSQFSALPVVLVIDEIDALVGDTLISVLRQIRSGYTQRPEEFPSSIVLCGVRDVRDYRIHSGSGKEIITGGSAFNIKAESLRMGDFVKEEVRFLLQQHTTETGQAFTPDAVSCIWHLSQGQPWLVNALAYEATYRIKQGRDLSQPIHKKMVDQAKENLIIRRETHLDQLGDKLQEPRVHRVVAGILSGRMETSGDLPEDDVQYVTDLGLIRSKPQLSVANPIYREIIPRMLTYSTQITLSHQTAWYITPDNRLNMDKLMAAFQQFFQEHSAHWLERFQYKEAGPQLLLQAFLQRVINSGGRIEREYGLGRQRVDLLVLWPLQPAQDDNPDWTRWQGPVQKVVVELKVLHKSLEKTLASGLKQTYRYMDTCGTREGHLVIFNRDPDIPWEDKIFHRIETYQGADITVWGM
ncbi:MAG TPA: AAA-like domain-containing protein [Desulfotignum sp.]|nr:AAA-like domain-containing protein [Desulfotignum sp.]